MAIVLCPECRAEVSSKAAACPQCGYPLTSESHVPARRDAPKPAKPKSYITLRDALLSTAWRLAGGMMLIGAAASGEVNEDIVALVILPTIGMFGSLIPLWWKARRSLKSGGIPGAPEIERRVEERLQAAEERFQRQLGELDDSARQMADLEERIEFTERLLTKYREEQLPR